MEAATDIARKIASERGGVRTPLSVNVVFYIPGAFFKPDFEGLSESHFGEIRELIRRL
jgi:hypothetical protein